MLLRGISDCGAPIRNLLYFSLPIFRCLFNRFCPPFTPPTVPPGASSPGTWLTSIRRQESGSGALPTPKRSLLPCPKCRNENQSADDGLMNKRSIMPLWGAGTSTGTLTGRRRSRPAAAGPSTCLRTRAWTKPNSNRRRVFTFSFDPFPPQPLRPVRSAPYYLRARSPPSWRFRNDPIRVQLCSSGRRQITLTSGLLCADAVPTGRKPRRSWS